MTQDSGLVMAQLEVARSELMVGLRQLVRLTKPAEAGDAILGFKNGQLQVRIGGGEISATATGRWPGEARAPGSFVLMVARHPPALDPLVIRVEGGHLHMGGMSVACHWQSAGAAGVEIPIGVPLAEILRIGMAWTDADLEQSGVLRRVEEARATRRALVQKAAAVLQPFAVRPVDIERLVDECLQRMPVPGGESET
jgi:hypothetical protein